MSDSHVQQLKCPKCKGKVIYDPAEVDLPGAILKKREGATTEVYLTCPNPNCGATRRYVLL